MKKLLLLGGSKYIIPVIDVAHKLGAYVITCDYLPNNIAHKYSDEYCNISITDKDAVLAMAREKHIDGVMSFACDPGVVTAAYVAEKLGLPFQCSYESTRILQDKGLFRKFLWDNGFNCPHSKRYTDVNEPFKDIDFFDWPVIVKPVDSAGSKGVSRVDDAKYLSVAIEAALEKSISKAFIIEDFITFKGYHSGADIFTINGQIKFMTYSDQLFDTEAKNEYTPTLLVWPTTMSAKHQDYLTRETQRLMDLLKMKNGLYDVETCIGYDGTPYIMEVSPRGGGFRLAEIEQMAMGVKLIENDVRSALGLEIIGFSSHEIDGHWCEMVIHSKNKKAEILQNVSIDPDFSREHIKYVDLSVEPGDIIEPYTGSNASMGDLFLRFNSREELDKAVKEQDKWLNICFKNQ